MKHLILLLCIFFLSIHCKSFHSNDLQCSIAVVNRISKNHLQFQHYNMDTEKLIKQVTLSTNVSNVYLVNFINNEFLFQSDSTMQSLQRISLFNLEPIVPDYSLSTLFNFNNLSNLLFTADRSVAMDGNTIFSIQQINGTILSIKPICKSSTSEILVGSVALRGDMLYYTSGPSNNFGIFSQNLTNCKLNHVAILHDHKTSSLMIPTNLFVYKNHLYATLNRDQGEDHGIIAKIDMVAQDYREVTDLTEEFNSAGKVMQRMVYLDSKNGVLSGWFASSDGSRSVLFLYDVEEEQVMDGISYQDQSGEWRAIASQCQPKTNHH